MIGKYFQPISIKIIRCVLLKYWRGGYMNKRWVHILLPVILGFMIPGVCLLVVSGNNSNVALPTTSISSLPENSSTAAGVLQEWYIPVLMDDSVVHDMLLEDYIVGVVLAEMPASFETEALKAQAVVARTYTLRRLKGNAKHPDAAVCTDPSCCQGYRDVNTFRAAGGTDSEIHKIQDAVACTEGVVLMYHGELIEATYFSCSGGSTEDAKAVWGEDVPYLKATESPGEEHATYFTHTQCYSVDEFQNMLSRKLKNDPSSWIGKITYTNGNGVEKIDIDGKTYSGTDVRRLLGLRSTSFTITILGDLVAVTTKGFGHRVGMSQYGADAMAMQGSNFVEILMHYYRDTELCKYAA